MSTFFNKSLNVYIPLYLVFKHQQHANHQQK